MIISLFRYDFVNLNIFLYQQDILLMILCDNFVEENIINDKNVTLSLTILYDICAGEEYHIFLQWENVINGPI
jgi:hypothetical protein